LEYTKQQVLDAGGTEGAPVSNNGEYSYSQVTGKAYDKNEKTALDKGLRAVGQIPLEVAGVANMTLGLVEALLNPAATIVESVYDYINTNDEEYVKKVKQQIIDAKVPLEQGKDLSITEVKKINELEGQLNGRTFANVAKEVGEEYDQKALFHPGTYIGDEAKAS